MKARIWAGAGAAVVVVAVAAVLGLQWHLEGRARDRLDTLAARLPPDAELRYEDVSVDMLSRRVHIHGVFFRTGDQAAGPLRVEQVVLHDYREQEGRPVEVHLEALGMQRSLEGVDTRQAQTLRSLGYRTLQGRFELSFRLDPAEGRFRLALLRADIEELGELEMAVSLDNLTVKPGLSPEEQRDRLLTADLVEARVSFRDDSLMRRVIAREAEERGESPREVVAALEQILAERLSGDAPFQRQAREALTRFLNDPGRLTLTARPPEPVSVARVVSVAAVATARLPEVLNLEIAAR